MFVDYLTIQLVAAASGLLFMGIYLAWVMDKPPAVQKPWSLLFMAYGSLLSATALYTVLTWPLPGSYNIIFGEPALYFGVLLLAGGIAVRLGDDLLPLSLVAMVGGFLNIIISVDILTYSMTQSPALAFAGYFASGLGAMMMPLAVWKKTPAIRRTAAVFLITAALVFGFTAAGAYIQHPSAFKTWKPNTMITRTK